MISITIFLLRKWKEGRKRVGSKEGGSSKSAVLILLKAMKKNFFQAVVGLAGWGLVLAGSGWLVVVENFVHIVGQGPFCPAMGLFAGEYPRAPRSEQLLTPDRKFLAHS